MKAKTCDKSSNSAEKRDLSSSVSNWISFNSLFLAFIEQRHFCHSCWIIDKRRIDAQEAQEPN